MFNQYGVSSFYTDYKGIFYIPIAKGDYTLEISKDGYETVFVNVSSAESEDGLPDNYLCVGLYPSNIVSEGNLLSICITKGALEYQENDWQCKSLYIDVTDLKDEVVESIITKTRKQGLYNIQYSSLFEKTVSCLYENGRLVGVYRLSTMEANTYWAYFLNGEKQPSTSIKEETAEDLESPDILDMVPEETDAEKNEEDEIIEDENHQDASDAYTEGLLIEDAA